MSEKITVSTVPCATDTQARDLDTDTVIEAIRSGGKRLRGQIEQIRSRLEAELAIPGGDLKAAKKAIGEFKLKLPGVLWSGTFTKRENDALVQHSGLLCADLDGLNSSLADIRQKLKDSPNLWALFISPSGDGLKAVFKVPADAAKHAGSFRAVEQHVRELTGVQIDEACKDVARLCFLSYDPELYYNAKAREMEPLPEPERPARLSSNTVVDLNARQSIAVDLLGAIDWQSETEGFCNCPGKDRHTAGSGAKDCKVYLDGSPSLHCVHNSCRMVVDAMEYALRSRIGKAEYKPLTSEQKRQTPEESSLNSLPRNGNSGGVINEFPEPLSDAALQGLAGDIVRRIEPHTEASPVALLIQTLTAYGSVIGRNAHSIADGSRHGANLFAVLVGESSKSRKGTSWQHVLRIFERADEDWKKNCVANGLSSGEGVIWAVRDPITKTVPKKEKGKFTGGHETVIADAGVDDKRLCVSEGEFANVLKVMAREGNTLSPVIRSAWDSDNLRTMTKNSEARATGAHISIIGHITRDELRRLLSETESANGFGNRFLWLAVRRSKCLPEGGNIDSEALNDLVVRLHKAIEFGRFAGEVAGAAARENCGAAFILNCPKACRDYSAPSRQEGRRKCCDYPQSTRYLIALPRSKSNINRQHWLCGITARGAQDGYSQPPPETRALTASWLRYAKRVPTALRGRRF